MQVAIARHIAGALALVGASISLRLAGTLRDLATAAHTRVLVVDAVV
jgi:hypothetical protein